jgi:hypothetical protein
MTRAVALTHEPPLWTLRAIAWPPALMTERELAAPQADYVGGYLTREAALAEAERRGWEVVG